MIKVKHLEKSYGHFRALEDVSFSVQRGEVLALLGPNGAGKTTTMKIITGFMQANKGSVEIDGEILDENSLLRLQSRIGYLPENAPLYPDLNVYEHLDFSAAVHKIPKSERKKAIRQVAKTCGLTEKLYFDISELSKGFKQRVGLAQALIHDPEILILDEPTTGLDPNQIIEIREFINELRAHKTIILSTHIMQEVEALADRVVVINRGNVVGEGDPENIGRETSDKNYHRTRIMVRGGVRKAENHLKKISVLEKLEKEDGPEKGVYVFSIYTTDHVPHEIAEKIVKADIHLLELVTERQRMEDVFQELTR